MSFLHDYNIFTSGNEAPQIFHRWAALSCLSHAVGRKVWVQWGILGNVYPHLYLIFVGDPGSKKSTAMNIAKNLILALQDIPIAGASITREALCQLMGNEKSDRCQKVFKLNDKPVRYSQMSIFANELVNLINSGGNPIGMIDFFTDVWDQDVYTVETKNKGTDAIIGPYISILGCLTPTTIRDLMSQKVVSGGMTRRCIFVLANKPERAVAFPEITPEQLAARERIVNHLKYVKTLQGEFVWEPAARAWFIDWYEKDLFVRKQSVQDQVLLWFLETLPSLVIKVAMLIQLSENPVRFQLSLESVMAATAMLVEQERVGSYLFSGSGRNELSPIGVSIMKMLEMEELPVLRKIIYRTHIKDATTQEIDQVIDSLVRTEDVVMQGLQLTKNEPVKVFVSTKQKMNDFLARLKSAGTGSKPGSDQPS